MNLLIVDDQKEIVNSLKNGIHWEKLPVEQVYTAGSAREAKLVLVNFKVDLLITDIEMPEENGLALAQWARENRRDIEIVFLTSHPDFKYAQEAIRLGSFDYILQPVRYEDVEKVVLRVQASVEKKLKIRRLENTRDLVAEQRGTILDAMLSKAFSDKVEDARLIFNHFVEMFEVEYGSCLVLPVLVQILRWKKITNVWDERLVRMVLGNVIEELFEDCQAKAAVSCVRAMRYWVFLVLPRPWPSRETVQARISEFYQFLNGHMDFFVGIYCSADGFCGGEMSDDNEGLHNITMGGAGNMGGSMIHNSASSHSHISAGAAPAGLGDGRTIMDISEIIDRLSNRSAQNGDKKPGIFWEDLAPREETSEDDFVSAAMEYVKRNINKNILRSDVAEYVHLNEEYFSRVFKANTGVTFKDYVLIEKMKTAQFLLGNTKLSVGIIASKVGYDNFSHFSKMFKKITNQTPQEYRKDHNNSAG